jgi:DNA polymerase III epsilon subunit family exonuclease
MPGSPDPAAPSVLAAFDVETTGLIPGVDRIVELGAVLFRGEEVLAAFDQLVDPGIPMPPEAQKVNGISDRMLQGMPEISAALPPFLALLSKGTPVAHNAVFDVGFLSTDIIAAGLEAPESPVLDTRVLARRAFPGRFSYSLANLVRDLGVQGAHRALADAHACRLLYLQCMRAAGVEKLTRSCGEPLNFTTHAPRLARTAAAIQNAIAAGEEVEIAYRSAQGERTVRTIRPRAFSCMGGSIGVVAFCSLRNERRTFLLDSITLLQPASTNQGHTSAT